LSVAWRFAQRLSIWVVVLLSTALGLADGAAGASLPRWAAPRLVDHVAPFGYVWELEGLSCPSASLCVGVGGDHVITSTDPTGGAVWNAAIVGARGLRMVSCPSEALCVAVDRFGNVLTSREPTRGASAWSVSAVTPGQELTDVACPSGGLCVATGYPSGVLISTDPTGGPAAWASLPPPAGYPERVACPSVSSCVAVGHDGLVSWLAIDSSGHGHWEWTSSVSGYSGVVGLSCPSVKLCVAVEDGDVLVSTTPTKPGSSWSVARIDSEPLQGVACASDSECVALDARGDETTSTRPAEGAGAWSEPMNVDPGAGNMLAGGGPLVAPGILAPTRGKLRAVSCPTARLCVALDSYGHSLTSENLTAGASAWHLATAAEGSDGFAAISCPSPSLCVGIDNAARVVSATNPGASSAKWRVTTVPGLADAYQWGIACIRRPLCVAFDRSYEASAGHSQRQQAFASIEPGGGPHAWRWMNAPGYLVGILPNETETSCPWKNICLTWRSLPGSPIAVIVTERHGRHHRRTQTYLSIYGGASCPSPSFCASVGPAGETNGELSSPLGNTGVLYTSKRPTSSSKWRASRIDATTLAGISCPSTSLCVAFDTGANVLSSTNAASAHPKWKHVHLGTSESFTELSCPSTHLCVARDLLGNVVTSTTPTGGASVWTTQPLDGEGRITSLACPSAHACVAVDGAGNVLVGTVPRR
jgi:hypothetical protein